MKIQGEKVVSINKSIILLIFQWHVTLIFIMIRPVAVISDMFISVWFV